MWKECRMPKKKTFTVMSGFVLVFLLYVFETLNYDHFSNFTASHPDILDEINIDCGTVFGRTSEGNLTELKNWKFDTTSIEKDLNNSENVCSKVRELFYFPTEPLSKEEAEYPLAYGLLVHSNPIQVLFMLNSFYHPQNEYCIAISNTASDFFKMVIGSLPDCFDNIQVLHRSNITWGSFEIINSTYACLEVLSNSATPWKYYQYLSGVDVPLKTNREMVAIFKTLNGTVNTEVSEYQKFRLRKKRNQPPLPLYKSSLSALIPRPTADDIVYSSVTKDLLKFLSGTSIPDEAFWTTLTGNAKEFPISGNFDAQEIIKRRKDFDKSSSKELQAYKEIIYNPTLLNANNYVSRLQHWEKRACHGLLVQDSCVFGVEDIADISKQPHLVAHKMYFGVQPAASICLFKEIRHRSMNPTFFNTSLYEELPMVQMKRGVLLQNISHPAWLFVV